MLSLTHFLVLNNSNFCVNLTGDGYVNFYKLRKT